MALEYPDKGLKKDKVMESKFFKTKDIAPKTTLIAGLGSELAYLLEGEKKALLIDTLSGAGNLRAFVRELTDLPITVINTHGHMDHAGGNYDFDECYIHHKDIPLIYEIKTNDRMNFVQSGIKNFGYKTVVTKSDFTDARPIKVLPVDDGDVFDLGGRKVEVIGVPGHTRGTIVLLDREIKMVFSGDACNVNTLLFLPHSTSIEEYKENLRHFKDFQPYFEVMYGGHGIQAVPKAIIDEAIELCTEIMEGRDDKVESEFLSRPCFYGKQKGDNFLRLDGKLANIAYSKEGIFKR